MQINVSRMVRFSAIGLLASALWSGGPALAQSASQHRCAQALQGKVAWNYSGDKTWSADRIARLCKGAESSAEPARCFREVMHGGVNWGGGTRWQTRNAIALCQGAKNARTRVSCFRKEVAGNTGWQQAIRSCGGTASLSAPGGLRSPLKSAPDRLRKPGGDNSKYRLRKDESGSGSVRFGDGEHGRVPPADRDPKGEYRSGGGRSGNITDRPFAERDLGRKDTGRLATDPDAREKLRLKPQVTGYRPSSVMQGAEVTVRGRMFGASKGRRRLILGVNDDPDHGLARELTARSWSDTEIRTRIPGNVLAAKYFVAIAGPDGKWVTNRLRTLRVLGRQKVTFEAVVELKCYADVVRRPDKLRVVLEPKRPADMGMDRGQKISIPVAFNKVSAGTFGSRLYSYTASTDVPQGLYEAGMHLPGGADFFKVRDWSRAEDAGGYFASKPCAAHRRIHQETGRPLKNPPVYAFKFPSRRRTVRIGPRTRRVKLKGLALADPAELGALPPPTPVDE